MRLAGGEEFWPGYCPRSWVFGEPLAAAWIDWVGLGYDLAQTGNLSVLCPPGAEFTAVAIDLLHTAGLEVAAIDRERREQP